MGKYYTYVSMFYVTRNILRYLVYGIETFSQNYL